MKKENTNNNNKVGFIRIALVAFIVTLFIGGYFTRVKAGETPEYCEELMQEYNVDSFDELVNYGH